MSNRKGFSLVELIVVVAIIGILSVVSYIAIQKTKERSFNDTTLDNLVSIANNLEQYANDHYGNYPRPAVNEGQNVNCYDGAAQYAHDCASASFLQGFVDNALIGKRYLSEVPLDPYTGSRYAYGVTTDGKYYQIAGLFKEDDGMWSVRTADNLYKGFELPSLIRAFDGPNFVTQKGTYLPYPSNAKQLVGTLSASVKTDPPITGGALQVFEGYTITNDSGAPVDIFFSDGSITTVDAGAELTLSKMEVAFEPDGVFTKIRIFLTYGKLWNKVARLASKSEFQIETSSAIAGVRGTEFGIGSDGAIIVESGTVWQAPLPDTATAENPHEEEQIPDAAEQDLLPAIAEDPVAVAADTLAAASEQIELTNNTVPVVLSADAAQVTVENLYVTLGIDDPVAFPILIDTAGVFEGEDITPVAQVSVDPSNGTDSYVINGLGGVDRKDFTIRFGYNGEYLSAPSAPPMSVKAGAPALTRADIKGEERPELTLVPSVLEIPLNNPPVAFSVGVRLTESSPDEIRDPKQITLIATGCDVTNGETHTLTEGRNIVTAEPFVMAADTEGLCVLSATVTFTDGREVEGEETVIIRAADAVQPVVGPETIASITVEGPENLTLGAAGTYTATIDSLTNPVDGGLAVGDNLTSRCTWTAEGTAGGAFAGNTYTPGAAGAAVITCAVKSDPNDPASADVTDTQPVTVGAALAAETPSIELTVTPMDVLAGDPVTLAATVKVENDVPGSGDFDAGPVTCTRWTLNGAAITPQANAGALTFVPPTGTLGVVGFGCEVAGIANAGTDTVNVVPGLPDSIAINNLHTIDIGQELRYGVEPPLPQVPGVVYRYVWTVTGPNVPADLVTDRPELVFRPTSTDAQKVTGGEIYVIGLTVTREAVGTVPARTSGMPVPPAPAYTVNVRSRWVLAEAGQSCAAACPAQTEEAGRCYEGDVTAAGDWNDTNSCNQCIALGTPVATAAGLAAPGCNATAVSSTFAPFYKVGNNQCNFRRADIALDCDTAPSIPDRNGGPGQSVCRCE